MGGEHDSIEKYSKQLDVSQIYMNSSGRRFEIERLDEHKVYLAELNDINEKIGERHWDRKTFAQALKNKMFDKTINRSKESAVLIKKLRINELMT